MEEDKKNQSFRDSLGLEVLYIRSYLLNQMDEERKEQFAQLETIYDSIEQKLKNENYDEQTAYNIYGQFRKTLKKFKRRTENINKFKQRDVDAFRKKQDITGQSFIALFHDIKMNVNDYMNKFDVNKVLDPNFQMHLYTCEELCEYAVKMIEYTKFPVNNGIDTSVLGNLIKELCLNYNVVPYHNFTHAFSLFQMLFVSYFNSELQSFVQPLEYFSAQLASLAHDVNHKGVNNLYKVNKRSEKALTYVDQAVLENMHASTFFRILDSDPKFNILAQLPKEQQPVFKKIAITSILATDMGKHNKLVEKLKKRGEATARVRKNPSDSSELDKFLAFKKEEAEDRKFVLNIMVHACDIGNPCLDFTNYMNWAYLLSQEFNDQTIKEQKKGVPVNGFLKYKDKNTYYNGQLFFSKTFVLPLWKEIAVVFPELQRFPDQINNNLKQLEEEKQKLSANN